MYNTLSPLMLIAGEGLIQNTGLGINNTLSSRINTYTARNIITAYASVISAAESALITANPSPPPATITSPSLNDIYTFANNTCPALVNAIPGSASIGSSTNRFTAQLTTHANNILGNGDLSKFVVQMYTVMAYTVMSGSFIDAAVTSNEYLGPTFTNMDDLISGSITSISLATVEFGTDLINTGLLIDLDKLTIYGTPHALIIKLATRGLLPYIGEELIRAGINPTSLLTKISGLGTNELLPLIIQKKCYEAFKTVKEDKLKTLMQALRVNLPMVYESKANYDASTTAMVTLADLIDTRKLFPTSFRTLTSPYKTGFKAIYLDNNGAVNGLFKNLGKDYYGILSTGLADANVAMRRALQQVKNVQNTSTDRLGASVQQIQTNYGLNLINSIDTPLPSSVYSYYTSSFGGGSGSNGRYYLSDGIGTPAGITHNEAFASLNASLDVLEDAGALDDLIEIFGKLETFLTTFVPDGSTTYTIPGIGGPYLTYEDGVDDCLAAAATEISGIASGYPTEYANLNTQFGYSVEQIEKELDTLADAGVVFADTPSSKQSIMSMVSNLHTYAIQNEYRGPAELLEKMADTTTQAGQALIGALREGRNISSLNTVGVGIDNVPTISADPADGTGEFETAQYSVNEAISNISTN